MDTKQEYVLGIALSANRSKILLIRKINPEWQRGLLNGIGGKIEAGETPMQAMIREFTEETGVVTIPDKWNSLGIIESDVFKVYVFCSFDDFIYQAKTVEKEVVEIFDVDIEMLESCGVDNLYKLVDLAVSS